MKCPHVAWEQVCQPKAVGGLSIRPAGFFNNAALAKLAWKVISGGVMTQLLFSFGYIYTHTYMVI